MINYNYFISLYKSLNSFFILEGRYTYRFLVFFFIFFVGLSSGLPGDLEGVIMLSSTITFYVLLHLKEIKNILNSYFHKNLHNILLRVKKSYILENNLYNIYYVIFCEYIFDKIFFLDLILYYNLHFFNYFSHFNFEWFQNFLKLDILSKLRNYFLLQLACYRFLNLDEIKGIISNFSRYWRVAYDIQLNRKTIKKSKKKRKKVYYWFNSFNNKRKIRK